MASQEKAASRPSATREATRKKSGYWARQRKRTRQNKLNQLDKHIELNPSDSVAKIARKNWILNR